jgi:hypothetical protein
LFAWFCTITNFSSIDQHYFVFICVKGKDEEISSFVPAKIEYNGKALKQTAGN